MQFDPNKPHGEVFGMQGVKWEQHGCLFGQDGHQISGPTRAAAEPPPLDGGTDYETMHWKRIKQLSDSFGFEWTGNTEDAISFLRGQSAAA